MIKPYFLQAFSAKGGAIAGIKIKGAKRIDYVPEDGDGQEIHGFPIFVTPSEDKSATLDIKYVSGGVNKQEERIISCNEDAGLLLLDIDNNTDISVTLKQGDLMVTYVAYPLGPFMSDAGALYDKCTIIPKVEDDQPRTTALGFGELAVYNATLMPTISQEFGDCKMAVVSTTAYIDKLELISGGIPIYLISLWTKTEVKSDTRKAIVVETTCVKENIESLAAAFDHFHHFLVMDGDASVLDGINYQNLTVDHMTVDFDTRTTYLPKLAPGIKTLEIKSDVDLITCKDFPTLKEIGITGTCSSISVSESNVESVTINSRGAMESVLTLILSSNVELTSFSYVTLGVTTIKVSRIQMGITNESVATAVAALINDTTAVDGNLMLYNSNNPEYNTIMSDAATTKGWTVEYVDAPTA